MALETRRWDTAEHLDTPEAIAAYLEAVMEDGDPALFTHALGQIARARGMTQIAKDAGVTREALYKALNSDGDPRASTLFGVIRALGLHLSVKPLQP
jgi:probable addiction module antidote protein